MKISKHLKYALEHWELREIDILPHIDEFFKFCSGCEELKNMYSYLRFLDRSLKSYAKTNHLMSFEEFMNYRYLSDLENSADLGTED